MAEVEMSSAAQQGPSTAAQTDLLIAIATLLPESALSSTADSLAAACNLLPGGHRAVLAIPEQTPVAAKDSNGSGREAAAHLPLPYVQYSLPPTEPAVIPWLGNVKAYGTICSLAEQLGARACTVLGVDLDLNRKSLSPERLALLLDPSIEGAFDLAMPLYATPAFDELINKSILYPLTRALYGQRIRNPLGGEFQMSSRFASVLRTDAEREQNRVESRLAWPGTVAATQNMKICQVRLGRRRIPAIEGIDLSNALSQLVGPLFADMEESAQFWQRVRVSHEVPTFGSTEMAEPTVNTVDVRRMVEGFQLSERNLRGIWTAILPPITLVELRKLARLTPDAFRIPNVLWARIVYDFALAHRLRNINRSHLFGAFTPLYLAWVASYAVEINKQGIAAAETAVEDLARAYESEKAYLQSRWRWPDRFHP